MATIAQHALFVIGTSFAFVLDELETLELLRRSMGRSIAEHYWQRMLHSKPHPNDTQEGEQR